MTPKPFNPLSGVTILYILPVLATLAFVHRFGVDVPLMDSFSLVGLFHKIHLETVGFSDFWVPHNEHRMLIPRVFIAAFAFATNWDIKLQLYLNVLVAVLAAISLFWISRQQSLNNPQTNNWRSFADIVTVVLLFSLVQYENWIWEFQLAWFWKTLCLVLIVALLQYPQPHRWLDKGFILAAIFGVFMSFSGAHGLLIWIAVFPLIWVRSETCEHPRLQRVIWLILFVGSVLLYVSGSDQADTGLDRTYLLKHPLDAIPFFLTILGRIFSTNPNSASWAGLVMLLGCGLSVWCFWTQKQYRLEIAAWLSLLLFPLGFAAMTTVGRAVLGIGGALPSRYTTVTILMLIGLIHIARICCQRQPWRLLYGAIAVVFAVFSISRSFDALEAGNVLYKERVLGKQCFSLVEYMEPSSTSCLLMLFPEVEPLISLWYPQLDQLGFFEFVDQAEFLDIPAESYGLIDTPQADEAISVTAEQTFVVAGWAIFPGRPETPEIVLLSRNDRPAFFAATLVDQESPDLVEAFNVPEYDQARWQIQLPGTVFSEGATTVRAWIYDGDRSFIPLSTSITVNR
jgi:hypothetical protein